MRSVREITFRMRQEAANALLLLSSPNLTLQADTELLDSYCDNQSIMQSHYSMGPRPEEPASPPLNQR